LLNLAEIGPGRGERKESGKNSARLRAALIVKPEIDGGIHDGAREQVDSHPKAEDKEREAKSAKTIAATVPQETAVIEEAAERRKKLKR